MRNFIFKIFLILGILILQTSCGFHLQGDMPLAPQLHKLYLQVPDPYGQLARDLQQNLKVSHVQLVQTPEDATTILRVLQDVTSENYLGGSNSNQTRQYNLSVTIVYEVTTASGKTIIGPETLTENRIMTIQSDQILGSSNEANLFYQQMRRDLAYALMNRLASQEVTQAVSNAFAAEYKRKK